MNDKLDISWWPRLGGRVGFVIAAGPSLQKEQVDFLQHFLETFNLPSYTVVINESWRLAKWADCHYICDWQYAKVKMPPPEAFKGRRILGTWPQHPPLELQRMQHLLNRLYVLPGNIKPYWGQDNVVAAGRNSTFQVMNWLAKCGCKRMVVLGLDCHSPNMHWHGSHDHPEKPIQKDSTMQRWRQAFQCMAEDSKFKSEIEVTNCSPGTAVRAFPRADLAVTLGRLVKKDAA